MISQSVPPLPVNWPLLSTNDSVEPQLINLFLSDKPVPSLSHCRLGGLEDVPLLRQTSSSITVEFVLIFALFTKNDKPGGYCTTSQTKTHTHTHLTPTVIILLTHSIILPGLKWDTTNVYNFINCFCVKIHCPKRFKEQINAALFLHNYFKAIF